MDPAATWERSCQQALYLGYFLGDFTGKKMVISMGYDAYAMVKIVVFTMVNND